MQQYYIFIIQLQAQSSCIVKSGRKIYHQTSPTESPCEMSTQRDSMLFSHRLRQDHTTSPLRILLAWTSNVDMASTQHSLVLLVSPPQLFCSLPRINEPHHCIKMNEAEFPFQRECKTYFTIDILSYWYVRPRIYESHKL